MSVATEIYSSIGRSLDARINNLTEEEAAQINAIGDTNERLVAAGFTTMTVAEFLGLSPDEERQIEQGLHSEPNSSPIKETPADEWDTLRREVRQRHVQK